MDFSAILLTDSMGFQPRIGEGVMLVSSKLAIQVTYLGLRFVENKVMHVYFHAKEGELESEEQISVPLMLAQSYLN